MRLEQITDLNKIDEANIRFIRTVRMNQLITQYENKKKKKTSTPKKKETKNKKEISVKKLDILNDNEKSLLIEKMKAMMGNNTKH